MGDHPMNDDAYWAAVNSAAHVSGGLLGVTEIDRAIQLFLSGKPEVQPLVTEFLVELIVRQHNFS
jgi:hypothetical protein